MMDQVKNSKKLSDLNNKLLLASANLCILTLVAYGQMETDGKLYDDYYVRNFPSALDFVATEIQNINEQIYECL